MPSVFKLSVFVSGDGGNLQAIMDAGIKGVRIAPVVCNNPKAHAIERAHSSGLPVEVVDHGSFSSRIDFEREIVARLEGYSPDLIVLAGFMRILSPFFVRRFAGRIMNIHPSLLPSFPGSRAVGQALDYGVKHTGCTAHFVDEEMDAGPVIIQSVVSIDPEDTEQTLHEKIRREEHRIYPEAIRLFAEGKLEVKGRKVLIR